MSDNVIFSYQNLVDSAATQLTASSSVGNNSISNVADPRVGKRWRVLSPGGYGQADFRANKNIDIVVLVFPRDTTLAKGTVQHQFDADGGTPGTGAVLDSGAVDIGLVDGYGYHIYRPSSTISARYWRWTYALTTAYADTGRAWAGTVWQPACNFIYGASDQWDDLSAVSISRRSGAEFVDVKPKQRGISFALDFMLDADRQIARELQRVSGLSGQVLVIKDPTNAPKETVLGRFGKINPILDANFSIFSQPYQVRESL